jgi:hypothetical protein
MKIKRSLTRGTGRLQAVIKKVKKQRKIGKTAENDKINTKIGQNWSKKKSKSCVIFNKVRFWKKNNGVLAYNQNYSKSLKIAQKGFKLFKIAQESLKIAQKSLKIA